MNARAAPARRLRHRGQGPLRAGRARADRQRLRPGPHRAGGHAAPGLPHLRHHQAHAVPRRQGTRRQARELTSSTTTTGCSTTTPARSGSRTATPSPPGDLHRRPSPRGQDLPPHRDARPDASWRPQAAMYDWAFPHGDSLAPVGRLVEPGTVPARPPGTRRRPRPPRGGAGEDARPGRRWRPRPRARLLPLPDRSPPAAPHPWVGVAALAAAVLLVALLAIRPRLRHRHQQQRSKSRPFA